MGLIDKIVNEPLGGAHRDPKQMAAMLKRALADSLRQFQGMKTKDLLERRHRQADELRQIQGNDAGRVSTAPSTRATRLRAHMPP